MQSTKRSKALKARWAKISKEERSAEMSRIATIKNNQMTKKQRIAHSKMMITRRKK